MALHLSRVIGKKTVFGVPNKVRHNRLYMHGRWLEALKFGLMYYLCSENEGADQQRGYRFYAFVFAYMDKICFLMARLI